MMNKDNSELNKALGNVQNLNLKAKPNERGQYGEYPDLEQVWDVLSGPLANEGIVVKQYPRIQAYEGQVTNVLVTKVCVGDQELWSEMPLTTERNDMQALGAAITYARRYSLCTIFNVVTGDRDGQDTVSDKPPKHTVNGPKKDKKEVSKDNLSTKEGSRSDKQLSFINKLLNQKGVGDADKPKVVTALTAGKTSKQLSNREASDLIDELKKVRKDEIADILLNGDDDVDDIDQEVSFS